MSSILQNVDLKKITAFKVGGKAEYYLKLTSSQQFINMIQKINWQKPYWFLGLGTNSLISDKGLPGLVLHFNRGQINIDNTQVIADSGANWDEVVVKSIEHNLYGIELLSGIPGTIGGATAININAYGQSLSDVLSWVEIYNPKRSKLEILKFKASQWGYKKSPLANSDLVIVRICLNLKKKITCKLQYATAKLYAEEHALKDSNLTDRRKIIMGVRSQAGSLLNKTSLGRAKTCGSFFKNPLVNKQQLDFLLNFEEKNINIKTLKSMNQIHGGQTNRISAAHVLLASGFKRGQVFKRVRLHPSHVLKLENYKSASAIEIYQVAKYIQKTVKIKLDIELQFEVNVLGEFESEC